MIYLDSDISQVNIGTTGISEVYVGSSKVYPAIPVGDKFTATYTGGRELAVPCDGNTTLTYDNVRPEGYPASAMTSAVIGDCVTTIGDGALSLCALTSVTIPDSVTRIGQTAFHICSGLTSVIIPDSVTSIGQGAFEYCFSLTSVTIPTAITSIEDYTFVSCSGLTSVTIPSGVTSIGNSAFQGCSGLTEIVVDAITPPTLAGSVFDDTNNCPIKVSCGSLAAYQQAWPSYASRLVENCDYGYFTTVAKSGGTIKFSGSTSGSSSNTLSYSTDNGASWSTAAQTPSVNVSAGDKVLWKGTCTPISNVGIGKFTNGTASFDVEGNAMSLLFGDNFNGQTSLQGKDYAFGCLFYKNTKVINAENLSLPATTLADCSYYSMFAGCTSLTSAPVLSAMALSRQCYNAMFSGCTSLTTAPALPSTALAPSCYANMFSKCTRLATAPELPAMTLADWCYAWMFNGCTRLKTAPELPAMTLAQYCYNNMFVGCTSLTTAPELPATTLALACYTFMFSGCTSLTTAPALPATTLAERCYEYMFDGCRSLTTAPALSATTLVDNCYAGMLSSCTSLNSIICLATDISATNCTYYWVNNVAATGTFTKPASMSSWTTGANGIPSGWTIIDT